jgi:hypothetical protein
VAAFDQLSTARGPQESALGGVGVEMQCSCRWDFMDWVVGSDLAADSCFQRGGKEAHKRHMSCI